MKKNNAAHECVSDDALSHLKSYKYSSVDRSLLSYYILNPYWNAFVKIIPTWIAPNMVTLIGFLFIVGNVALLELFMPDLVGPGPSWIYYSFALGMWMYQTMDNIDGKQARRTNQSSGLGELFDHGIDSLNCTLASLLEMASMGLGSTPIGLFTALTPCIPMFFSTWETYHTHTLYLGYFNGPTEGLVLASMVMAASGYFGPEIWHTPLSSLVGFHSLLGDMTTIDIWIPLIVFTLTVGHIPTCVYNVSQHRKNKDVPLTSLFFEWTPFFVFEAATVGWLYSPYSTLLQGNHLVLFCLTMSFVFGRMTTKMILAHLTRQPFPYWTVMLVPLVTGAVLINAFPLLGFSPISPAAELWYLRAYFIFAMVAYFRWAFLVCGSICNYLDINCLTITPRLLPAELRPTTKGELANGPTRRSERIIANGDTPRKTQ